MGELVRSEHSGGRATITLDSPHNRNALSQQLVRELGDCLDEASRARVIVLRHEGPAFCAGADLKERKDDGAVDSRPMVAVMERLMDVPCPTIAAVNGAVRAGGIGLMASCDLVVVNPAVDFALTEVRIGVAAAIISVPILRRVPPGKIAAAMLTGDPFDAHHAREIGLVSHVADDVDGTVDRLCHGVLAGAPGAVAATKDILRRVPGMDRGAAFDEMRRLSEALFLGPEGQEGMAAFRERRLPVWPEPSHD
ncbi:MAG TPA: enoyl-CoA hydratase-related protein [Ilumatobacter sp.]|nr:enoyl-CoA hydratase-related protein [Ilumatobacter sp.]